MTQDTPSLRIGIDGDTLGRKRTGDESYLSSLMRGLGRVDRHNEYVVYVRDAEAVAQQFDGLNGWQFRRVAPSTIWLRYPIGFPMLLRSQCLDVLHVQYFAPPWCKCPVVVTVHDISFAVRPEFFTRKDRVLLQALVPRSLRRADKIITDAEYTKNELVRVYDLDPDGIAVIPLAADPRYCQLDREECRRTVWARHGFSERFVLYVGTLQPRKNVSTLIRAYALMRQRTGLDHKLVIVGKPKYKYESVFTAIAETGLEKEIVFAGFVPDQDLPVYYNAAEVFVFPSRYEGFGLPVLEAMACGTPVVTSSASCLPEVAGDAALAADPDDPEAFCEQMTRVIQDTDVAAELARAGLRRAASLSWDRTAQETLAVYEEVARAGR